MQRTHKGTSAATERGCAASQPPPLPAGGVGVGSGPSAASSPPPSTSTPRPAAGCIRPHSTTRCCYVQQRDRLLTAKTRLNRAAGARRARGGAGLPTARGSLREQGPQPAPPPQPPLAVHPGRAAYPRRPQRAHSPQLWPPARAKAASGAAHRNNRKEQPDKRLCAARSRCGADKHPAGGPTHPRRWPRPAAARLFRLRLRPLPALSV